jgi:hypothetical protein
MSQLLGRLRFWGTAFPASWNTLIPFFRSDLGMWCWWDGTRWLSATEYSFSFAAYVGGALPEWSGSTEVGVASLRQDYASYITRWSITNIYLSGLNNGSNYWKLYLRTFTGLSTIKVFDTSAGFSGGAWNDGHEEVSGISQPGLGTGGVQFYVETVGSPGGLRAYPTVFYRLIIT